MKLEPKKVLSLQCGRTLLTIRLESPKVCCKKMWESAEIKHGLPYSVYSDHFPNEFSNLMVSKEDLSAMLKKSIITSKRNS
jgi:hypothetical protein